MSTPMGDHGVQVRLIGTRYWKYLRPDGGMTKLWIHASLMSAERAAERVAEIVELNPGYEARVAPWPKKGR